MFKALAQRIARYVLRDELSFYETECTKLQDELDRLIDIDYEVYVHTDKLNNELRAENDGLRIDLDNASDFTNELMAELRELRGAKDNAVRLLNLCEPPF